MNTNQNTIGLGFWFKWVFASCLGFAIGGVLSGSLGRGLGEGFAAFAIVGAIFGAAGGMMQRLVLRPYVNQTGEWVLATAIGWALASIPTELVFRRFPFPEAVNVAIVTFAGAAGVAGGILQWLVLRRIVADAGWWAVANILGLTVGMRLVGPIVRSLGQTGSNAEFAIVFGSLFALGVGAIPGAVLVWLLRQPESGSSATTAEQGAT